MKPNLLQRFFGAGAFLFALKAAAAAQAEPVVAGAVDPAGMTWGIVRLVGALAIVFSVFFAGVWLFKNSQRFLGKRGGAAKLRVVESRSLGARQTIYVIGYEKQRMLIGSSPSGISFLSALPVAEEEPVVPVAPNSNFSDILRKALNSR